MVLSKLPSAEIMIFFIIIYAVRTVLFRMLSVYKTEHILATIKN